MPPHFTTLPREIRDAILELCLVVEGPINPYPAYYADNNPFANATFKPDISLLAVSKTISAEAAEVFYGKNVWVIEWVLRDEESEADEEPEFCGMYGPMDEFWYIHRKQIYHVSLFLDVEDLSPESLNVARRLAYEKFPKESSAKARREAAHNYRGLLLKNICQWKIGMCQQIGAKSVAIDIENLFCNDACCRRKAIWRCCFNQLRDWARMIEEVRANEGGPAFPRGWGPEVTLVGFLSMDDMTAARQVWERQWGPLNHYMNGNQICLEGFFLPREAKPVD